MAAASDALRKKKKKKKKPVEQHRVRSTDGQDGYNEARRCQRTAPD